MSLEKLKQATETLIKVETSLFREKEILEILVDLYSDGYWDWNFKKDYKYLSPKLTRQLGYTQEELGNDPGYWKKICKYPEDIKEAEDQLRQHMIGERNSINVKLRLTHKNGNELTVICKGIIIERDEKESPLRMVGIHSILF